MDVTELRPFFFWYFSYGFRHNKNLPFEFQLNIEAAIFADFRNPYQYLLLHITKMVFYYKIPRYFP